MYESAVASFENFRLYYNLSNIWPVPLSDIVNFIAYLEKNELRSINNKVIYIWFEFQNESDGYPRYNVTKSFVITKMLSGMERMHKRVNARKPITLKFWKRSSTSCYMFAILTMKQHFLLLAFQ